MGLLKLFKRKQTEMDLTEGNLFKKIPLFCLPLALTAIFQLFYTTIDLATVSNYGGGSLSMTAVGSNSALINLIITMFVSLATGANVVISIAKGKNDKQKAEKILHTAFVVSIIGGLIIALVGMFLSEKLLRLMDTPESIIHKASLYLEIYFAGAPFLMIYNFGSQMLRALGDSKRPLYILIISGLFNIVLDFILVYFFNMDVAGVGLATIASEAISAIFIIMYFRKSKTVYVNLDYNKLKIDKECLKEMLKIGIPAGIQGIAFSIPNLLIQSSLYTITNYSINGIAISQDEIISGAAAAGQVEGYVFALVNSFAIGIVSFVGQNMGARKIENVKKTYWYSVIWMGILSAVCCAIVYPLSFQLLKIFITESTDVTYNQYNALLAGRERMYIMISPYFFDGIMAMSGQYLRGMKRSTAPAIVTLVGCTGFRILFLTTFFQLEQFHTIFWLYAAFPISWILVDLAYIPIILILEKKEFKKIEDELQKEKIKNAY